MHLLRATPWEATDPTEKKISPQPTNYNENTTAMNHPKPSSEEIARRKRIKATRLLGEVCGLAGDPACPRG